MDERIRKILSAGTEAQDFSGADQDLLCAEYPEHAELIRGRPDAHSSFWTLFNKRQRRDRRFEARGLGEQALLVGEREPKRAED